MKRVIIGSLGIVLFSLGATIFLFQYPWLLTGMLLLAAGSTLYEMGPTRPNVMLFVVAGVVGLTFEILCIAAGVWSYAIPQLLGAPVWLPVLWGIAALIIVRAERVSTYLFA